ncbi:MAG: FG-GAP-like repeat-containing protein [Myxococcota bacterium]
MNTQLIVSILPRLCFAASTVAPVIAVAGDLDGDDFDDILVGAHRLDHSGLTDVGAAAIARGSHGGLVADQVILPLAQGGERAGFSVAIGDFNCDGMDDLAMGSPLENFVVPQAGIVYVYTNLGGGLFQPSWITAMDFDPANTGSDHFGRALAVADFDQDSCDDLAIGAPRAYHSTGVQTGLVYVAMGDAAGPRPTPQNPGMVAEPKWNLVAQFDDARFGFSLSVGDIYDEGTPDLIIGAPTRVIDGVKVGSAAAFSIQNGEFAMSWGTLSPCASGVCAAENEGRWYGWSTATGDFDGDGSTDIAVGAPGYQNDHDGRVYLHHHGQTVGHIDSIDPTSETARFGYAMAAGDLDEDGFDELVVGAPQATLSGGPDRSGAVFVFAGHSAGLVPPVEALTPMQTGNYANSQKFGAAVSLGYYTDTDLDLAVGAKRAKDSGIRSGGVFLYTNDGGQLHHHAPLGLSDFSWAPEAGALFGSALSQ